MYVIKRVSDNTYYEGVPSYPEEGQVLLYTLDKKQGKRYTEQEKLDAILFSNEEWEEC
jgi:hypothetical protein